MVEPCAAAFSRSLDMRGSRPGDVELKRSLPILEGIAFFTGRRRSPVHFDMSCRLRSSGATPCERGKFMMREELTHPQGEGDWTLLQTRHDRSFWQRSIPAQGTALVRFVITRPPEVLAYDTFDEAQAMFEAMDED